MYIVIICSLLCLYLTYCESKGGLKNGMKLGFVLTTALQIIHYDYGNDYLAYYENCLETMQYSLSEIIDGSTMVHGEKGWLILCNLSQYIGGFFVMMAIIYIIQAIIVFKSIRQYVDKKWWPMSIFIYLFMTSFYMMSFTMLRQYLAMIIVLATFTYIKDRKWWKAGGLIILSIFIHTSSIIMIPFAFAGYLPLRNSKILVLFILGLFFALFMSSQLLSDVFSQAMLFEQVENYSEIYEDGKDVGFGLGFLISLVPFLLSLYYLVGTAEKDYDNGIKILVLLGSIAYIVIPFVQIIPLINRLSWYFSIFQVLSLPHVYKYIRIKSPVLATGCISLFVMIILYMYWAFFTNGVYVKSFGGSFSTIFENF